MFSLLCPRSHSVPLPCPTISEARFSAFDFPLMHKGPLPVGSSLPLVGSGPGALTFLSPQPALCTQSQAPHAHLSALDRMKAGGQCKRQMFGHLPVAIFCCFLWTWEVASFSHLFGTYETRPPPWVSSLAFPCQLLLGHLILAVKFMILVSILLSKAFLRHFFWVFLQYIQ